MYVSDETKPWHPISWNEQVFRLKWWKRQSLLETKFDLPKRQLGSTRKTRPGHSRSSFSEFASRSSPCIVNTSPSSLGQFPISQMYLEHPTIEVISSFQSLTLRPNFQALNSLVTSGRRKESLHSPYVVRYAIACKRYPPLVHVLDFVRSDGQSMTTWVLIVNNSKKKFRRPRNK